MRLLAIPIPCRRAVTAALTLTFAAAASALAANPAPPRYTAVDLAPFSGWATGINSAGDIAGAIDLIRPVTIAAPGGGGVTYLNTGGALQSAAYDINDSGAAVGIAYTPGTQQRAVVWNGAGITELNASGVPGTPLRHPSAANSINNSGLIVGTSTTLDGVGSRAIAWTDSSMTILGTLAGYDRYEALGVNNSGLAVGHANTIAGVNSRPVAWTNGVAADLGTLGGPEGYAQAVNDEGWIVGWSELSDAGEGRATLWRDGQVINLGIPEGGNFSAATGINAAGDIVGYYTDGQHQTRPFLYRDGVMHDFLSLLETDTPLTDFTVNPYIGINDAGWFAATAIRDGEYRFLLFQPVPEPSSAGLAVCAVTGALRRRRRSGR